MLKNTKMILQKFLTSKFEAYYLFYFYIDFVIKSIRLRWAGHVARMEEGRSPFKILTGEPTGKRSLGRLRRT